MPPFHSVTLGSLFLRLMSRSLVFLCRFRGAAHGVRDIGYERVSMRGGELPQLDLGPLLLLSGLLISRV
jgi:hypothetical protein